MIAISFFFTKASFAQSMSITDPCACASYGGGDFNDEITNTSQPGQVWTITSVTGLTINGALPLGFQPTEGPTGEYVFQGVHQTDIGYTLTVTNQDNFSLSIANTCYYPNPVIEDLKLLDQFCLNTPAFPLKGNASGVDGTGTFTIDGTEVTEFDASSLGVGNHTVTYSFDAGTATPFSQTDPGCADSASVIVQVIETPTQLNCLQDLQISMDDGCQTFIHPSMILAGN